jgi:hypothetical protein
MRVDGEVTLDSDMCRIECEDEGTAGMGPAVDGRDNHMRRTQESRCDEKAIILCDLYSGEVQMFVPIFDIDTFALEIEQ